MPLLRTRECEKVRDFLLEKVYLPALKSNELEQSIKNKVQSSVHWINKAKKAGDIKNYIDTIIKSERVDKGIIDIRLFKRIFTLECGKIFASMDV